jgi:glycosyltransferase involved in cell wall biosynthesis
MGQTVTICIPVYNMERTIAATIESAINQTYGNVEILVLDNCSTDQTFSIATQYAAQGVRVEKNPSNLGAYGNHNRCVELASGDWIKFLHGDDDLLPNCIEQMMTAIGACGHDISLAVCGAICLDGDNRVVRRTYTPEQNIVLERSKSLEFLLAGNIVGTPTMTIIRRDDITRFGAFDVAMEPASDGEMWFRFMSEGKTLFLAEHLVAIRDDPPESIAKRSRLQVKFLDQIFRYVEKIERSNVGTMMQYDIDIIHRYLLNESVRFFDMAIIYALRGTELTLLKALANHLSRRGILIAATRHYIVTRILGGGLNSDRKQTWPQRLERMILD